jgi:hypothetical protein
MRRAGDLFEDIISYDNLRRAVHRAQKGKRDRQEVRDWIANQAGNLKKVIQHLRAAKFSFGNFYQFVIFDPKERVITAPCFEERVVHHAIMNVVEPYLDRWLIDDTFACRKGKGRQRCLLRVQNFARASPWFLKLDIRKYFDSVSHDRLMNFWCRRFKDRRLQTLISAIVNSYRAKVGKGLPIGSLTSQHLANFYLGWLDRFIKEKLRIRGYVRYMDDMALWLPDFQTVKGTELSIRGFLTDELDLEPKPDPYANRTSHGMDFLGCRVFPTHLVPNRRSRTRFRRKWQDLSTAHNRGAMSENEFQTRVTSLASHLTTAGIASCHFRRRTLFPKQVSGRENRPA